MPGSLNIITTSLPWCALPFCAPLLPPPPNIHTDRMHPCPHVPRVYSAATEAVTDDIIVWPKRCTLPPPPACTFRVYSAATEAVTDDIVWPKRIFKPRQKWSATHTGRPENRTAGAAARAAAAAGKVAGEEAAEEEEEEEEEEETEGAERSSNDEEEPSGGRNGKRSVSTSQLSQAAWLKCGAPSSSPHRTCCQWAITSTQMWYITG